MRKNKICHYFFIMALFALLFASCASSKNVKTPNSPIQTEIGEPRIAHPYEYFDFNKDLYLTFPVVGNEELFSAVLQKVAPGMSKFSVKQLLDKTKFFYFDASLDFLFDETKTPSFQFCATGAFPTSYRSMLFTNNNGFRQVKEEQKDRIYEYFYNREGKFFIDIPEAGYCLADTDYLSGMLLAYENTKNGEVYKPEWKEEIINLMFNADESKKIDWYVANAEPIVTMLLGGTVRLPLQYAFGTMEKIENSSNAGAGAANATSSAGNATGKVLNTGSATNATNAENSSLLYKINATLETTDKRFVKPNVAVLNRFFQQMHAENNFSSVAPTVKEGENCQILISDWVVDLTNVLNGGSKNFNF